LRATLFFECRRQYDRVTVMPQPHAALMSRLPLRRQHVTLEDLQAFLPADKAAAALATLDVDRDGAVSLHDMRDAVLQVCSRLLRLVCLVSFHNCIASTLRAAAKETADL